MIEKISWTQKSFEKYDYLKQDEIINVKSNDDEEFIKYFESQKEQGRYKYLKFLDPQTLFYSDKDGYNEGANSLQRIGKGIFHDGYSL